MELFFDMRAYVHYRWHRIRSQIYGIEPIELRKIPERVIRNTFVHSWLNLYNVHVSVMKILF